MPTAWISEPRSYDDLATDPADGVGSNGDHRPGNPIGSTVHHFDPETDSSLARNRHYRPDTGRWMQRDPVGYVDGMGLYNMSMASPVRYTDPFGLCTQEDCNRVRNLDIAIAKACGTTSVARPVAPSMFSDPDELRSEAIESAGFEVPAYALGKLSSLLGKTELEIVSLLQHIKQSNPASLVGAIRNATIVGQHAVHLGQLRQGRVAIGAVGGFVAAASILVDVRQASEANGEWDQWRLGSRAAVNSMLIVTGANPVISFGLTEAVEGALDFVDLDIVEPARVHEEASRQSVCASLKRTRRQHMNGDKAGCY